MRKRNNFGFRKRIPSKDISGCLVVTAEECGGNPEKMVRRFIKKAKNEKIVEEFRERTHYKKPSQIKAEKRRDRRRVIEKVNKQNQILFNKDRSSAQGRKKRPRRN